MFEWFWTIFSLGAPDLCYDDIFLLHFAYLGAPNDSFL